MQMSLTSWNFGRTTGRRSNVPGAIRCLFCFVLCFFVFFLISLFVICEVFFRGLIEFLSCVFDVLLCLLLDGVLVSESMTLVFPWLLAGRCSRQLGRDLFFGLWVPDLFMKRSLDEWSDVVCVRWGVKSKVFYYYYYYYGYIFCRCFLIFV